ncbi:hypothetical protein E0L36_23595 [Streptomyces sp. AJS327]|uniref:NAD(P)/FAD-dependent oxidoreductase n=1 Tax=Streptomyces sp. AJS327 TaxID=2545265 RepID=UPI0015DF8F2E|nr:FAD-dependent monooxygenase [Streptomyces sp. AJS327]MBA0053738.1 hypothetical protein [Streptomyces sp. AJS327]
MTSPSSSPDPAPEAPGTPDSTPTCDVAVLGGRLSAGILATVLAAHGARVTVVDDGAPPAVPQSAMGVHASALIRVIAERYEVPELAHLATVDGVREHVTTTVGAEHAHSFLYHRPGRPLNPDELVQVCPPKGSPPDPHYYRPEVDAHLLRLAENKGARVLRGAKATEVAPDAEGVTVRLAEGEPVRARFLVDASGPDSPLVERLGLREEPTRFTTSTRTLATHMRGVRPLESVVADRPEEFRSPVAWSRGSNHHMADGVRLSVIPLGNHPEPGGDGPFGVTLTVDAGTAGSTANSPEAEFREIVSRFPTLAAQFEGARAEGEWTVTTRDQHSVREVVGERWCLLGDAAGYVDPFISRGLSTALETVNVLTWRLLRALARDDFTPERFAPVGEFLLAHQDANDQLAAMAHASLRDPRLLKSVLFVLEVGFRYGGFPMMIAHARFRSTGDDSELRALETLPHTGHVFPGHEGFYRLFGATATICAQVRAGTLDADTASERVFRMVREADFVPAAFEFRDPSVRFLRITPVTMLRLALWSFRGAPKDIAPLIRGGLKAVLRGG